MYGGGMARNAKSSHMIFIMNTTSTICLRAGRSTYLVFAVMFAVPLLINLLALLRDRTWWQPVIIILFVVVACFAWLWSFKIVVANGRLTYSNLFQRPVSVQLSEIAKVDIQMGCFTYLDRFKPTIRLIIRCLPSTGKNQISINMKVFNKKQIDALLDIIDPLSIKAQN